MKNKKIALIFVLIMIINYCLPIIEVFAKDDDSNYITGTYNFTSNETYNIQLEDTFKYSDYLFKKSSFENNVYLELLSSQAAIASASIYGEGVDKYEVDPSENANNIINFLNKIGFKNIDTNKYYTVEKQENSAGVAVGYKNISTSTDDYTLLAIIPRSAGYKQEWVGNFTLGDGDIHQGFKAARDEILRFVKQYLTDNEITGKIKVWTTGHSRGAALANMIGGFFAGGGIEYFSNVSITPEDVYCYTFATPRTIKNNLDKNIELTVEGNRSDIEYENDTVGTKYEYKKGGKVNVEDTVYGGIRNIISSADIFTMLPPEDWGFTHYGTVLSVDYNNVSEAEMLDELKTISLYAYNKYQNGGNPNLFERKDFDLKTLSIIKDNNNYSAMNINSLLKEKLKGLTNYISSNKEYKDDGYQDVVKGLAGLYGMSASVFDDDAFDDLSNFVSPVVLSYLAYESEKLINENKASNEKEAVTIIIEDLLNYFTGSEINNENFTLDDFIILISKYIADNENEPISDKIIELIISAIPDDYQVFLSAFTSYAKKDYTDEVTIEEGLKAYLKACYYGADPDSVMYADYSEPFKVRQSLYTIALLALYSSAPDIVSIIQNNKGEIDGSGKFEDLVGIILNIIKVEKDDKGNVIKTYNNLGELADFKINEILDFLFGNVIEKSRELYGDGYANDLNEHLTNVKKDISKLREALIYILLYSLDGSDISSNIKTLSTLFGNINIIPLAHYNEVYIAYSRARANKEEFPSEPISEGIVEVVEPDVPNSNNAKIEGSVDEIIENIGLTDSEKEAITDGKNIKIYLEVKDLGDLVLDDSKKQIEEIITNDETIAFYLDINLFKEIDGEEPIKVSELNNPVKISFEIPDELINKNPKVNRIYTVYSLHNGEVIKSNVTVNGNIGTFETDKFSTYAVTYNDILVSDNPQTSDNIINYVYMLIISTLGMFGCFIYYKRIN